MKIQQKISKSQTLLDRIAKRDVTSLDQLVHDQVLLELFSWHTKRAPAARIKDTLAVLVRQGSLSQGMIDGQKLYKITSKGRHSLAKAAMRKALITNERWTGRWYFVTYQIPEGQKVARNQFLIELKRLGFRRYSSALWIHPYDLSVSVKKIAHHLGVEKHIDILRADTISQAAIWKRRFNLAK